MTEAVAVSKAERFKQLGQVEAALNKQFKTTVTLMRLGGKVGLVLPSFATGLPTLDYYVIGTGGIPKGRIVEVFGPESSGKTSLVLHVVGQEQARGGLAAYIDAEHALDPTYASTLGVNVDELLISQPDCGEQALETVQALVQSGLVDIIGVDSVAALVPRAELEGDMGDAHVGLQARLMSQAMRKLTAIVAKSNCTVIFINQIREKIGVMFGSPETTTGGRALKFFSSIRIDIRRRAVITEGGGKDGAVLGHHVELKAVKNKVGVPLRSTIVDLMYGKGFDMDGDLVQYAISLGVVTQAGAWMKFKGESYHKANLLDHKAEIEKEVAAVREQERKKFLDGLELEAK